MQLFVCKMNLLSTEYTVYGSEQRLLSLSWKNILFLYYTFLVAHVRVPVLHTDEAMTS